MRKFICVGLAFLAMAGTVRSAEDSIDTDLMQSIEDTNKELASNIAVQEAQAAVKNAKELHEMFRKVESFYAGRPDVQDAQDLTRKSLDLTEQIQKQVGEKDFGTASGTATTLSRTCKTCHNFHKKS